MMKKITLLFLCLSISLMYGQVPTIDFETNGSSYLTGGTFTIGTGVGTNTTQVANLANGAGAYDAYQVLLSNEVDFSTSAKTISFDFYQSASDHAARQILVKFQNGTGDPVATNGYEVEITAPDVIGWQTLQFDFSSARESYPNTLTGVSLVGSYKEMYIFIDFGAAVASNTAIDNIGGAVQGAVIAGDPAPTVAAPTPPARAAADVISIFSGAYTDIAVSEWSTTWDNSDISDVQISGDDVKKVNYGTFLGIQLTNSIDLSSFTHMHFDYWVADALSGGEVLNPKLSNHAGLPGTSGETSAIIYTNPVTTSGSWVSFDVPLADFTLAGGSGLDRDKIYQMLLDCSATLSIVYFDNIYFYKGTALGTKDFAITGLKVFPNPAKDNWTVSTKNIKMSSIEVFDILGKNVLSLKPNTSEAKINGANLRSGLYFAKISTANGASTLKLVKE